MNKIGVEKWIFMPLEQSKDAKDLEYIERNWMHNMRHFIINDEFSWTKYILKPKLNSTSNSNSTPFIDKKQQRIVTRKELI